MAGQIVQADGGGKIPKFAGLAERAERIGGAVQKYVAADFSAAPDNQRKSAGCEFSPDGHVVPAGNASGLGRSHSNLGVETVCPGRKIQSHAGGLRRSEEHTSELQ